MTDIDLSNYEIIKVYDADTGKFSQKITKFKHCMVYPKTEEKGMVSVADSSFELVFNYDYMEEELGGYTFYNTKNGLIMYVG